MNKIYLVNHCFDVDGGFGDAILLHPSQPDFQLI